MSNQYLYGLYYSNNNKDNLEKNQLKYLSRTLESCKRKMALMIKDPKYDKTSFFEIYLVKANKKYDKNNLNLYLCAFDKNKSQKYEHIKLLNILKDDDFDIVIDKEVYVGYSSFYTTRLYAYECGDKNVKRLKVHK